MNTKYGYIKQATRLMSDLRLTPDEVTPRRSRGYASSVTRLRLVISLLLFLVLGSGNVWGATIDFNQPGYYYLGNDANDNGVPAYDGSDFNANFYMCPAYSATVSEENYLGGDSEKPLITTYKSFSTTTKTYSWAVWYIEAATGDNAGYFYIKHRDSGKYLVANDNSQPATTRRRVNLGPTDKPGGNDGLFYIQSDDDGTTYYIYPKEKKDGNNKYLTPSNGNKDDLSATSANKNTGGIIGFYTAKVKNSAWHFVLVPTEKPTITYDNTTNEVTMVSATTGATIYYTTDGSEPDKDHVGGSNPTKQYDPDSKPIISTPTTIKAIAVADNYDVSEVRSLSIQKVETPIKSISATGMIELSSATPSSVIYYTIGDTEPKDPTASSTLYTDPLDNAIGKYIKAIGVKEGWINSDILSTGLIQLQCATPVITRVGMTFTISCVMPADAAIYYSINGGSETLYSGPVAFTNDQLPITVTAVAKHSGYTDSEEASITLRNGSGTPEDPYLISGDSDFSTFITDVNNGTAADKCFKLISDISASGVAEITTNFTGSFDGGGYTISGLSHPLFNTVDGGVVKNVMLKDVQISGSGNVGAIAGEASGYTRIYNCGILPSSNKFENESSYVSSSDGYCGGLVGWLKDDSRVINCFSFANVNGGTVVAGIVGYNDFASTTKVTDGKYTQLKTAIVNCMFYGNITGGTTRYPVYGGNTILNNTATGINNYDFYRAEANLGLADNSHYNCSWPAKEEYLTKYEYYRYLLNSNRELCGWWVGAPSAPSGMLIADVQAVEKDASLMAKWVLDPSIAPYPILKAPGKYYSAINQDPDNRINPVSKAWESRQTSENTITTKAAPDTEGQKLGSITVTINKGGSLSGSSSKNITITAMDIENNDFCYGKIQLPYYNSIFGDPNSNDWTTRYGGNYGDKVVVGWEITNVTGGTEGTLVKNWQTGYNFADRDCTNKDKERIFAQGGYYYVPNGVSAITITAKWANAVYLDNSADHSYDRVYMSYNTNPNKNIGYHFAPAGSRPSSLGNGETVQTASVSSKIPDGNVYEEAIVLVGNHQYRTDGYDVGTKDKGCTIISADFDFDDEPDYCLEWQLGTGTNRQSICPIRFDFLPVIEIGMAMKEDGSTQYYSLGCYLPLGHFEVTETSLIHFGQFEFGNSARTKDAPLILNGGIFDQYCKGTKAKTTADDHIDYVILGGNVYMPSFSPGAHVNSGAKYPTRHCAVNVLGGRINNLYLTGNFNNGVTPNTDNPHCYIDGGNFKQIAAAAKEGIKGDVYFRINHSVINEFYGGSTLADKLVTGSIDVTVDNSKITKYCGGPKFGNMASGKTVTTNATGTTFGVYYGGGNGGTSYVQYESADNTVNDVTAGFNWNTTGKLNSYTPAGYRSGDKNYMADYEMEIVNTSTGTDAKKGIFRTYLYAAQFSATNTGPITNNLTNCKVLTSFYGGGNLGGVIGGVTSTLTDTEVMGSAFGAGYSASVPEVTIYNKDKTAPTLNVYTGIITPTPNPDPNSTSTTYTWCYKNKTTNVVIPSGVVIPDGVGTGNPAFEYEGKKYFYTEESLENLGTVTGKATLTINGTTTVRESVYGGGEESGVGGDTEVTVNSGAIGIKGESSYGYRYGNVYGGGKGKIDNEGNLVVSSVSDLNAGLVKGNTSVTINGTTATTTIVHNVYGGGAVGSVGTFDRDDDGMPTACTANTGNAVVTINGGLIGHNHEDTGMINGSSRGWEGNAQATGSFLNQLAWVNNAEVFIGDSVSSAEDKGPVILGSIYGGGENGHNFKDAVVRMYKGTVGNSDPSANSYNCGNIYGAGCGTDTYWDDANGNSVKDPGEEHYNPLAGVVRGNATVIVKGGHVLRNVYGAGAMGSVGNEDEAEGASTSGKTTVTITGNAKIGADDGNGNIYGAARGDLNVQKENFANVRTTEVEINGNADIKGSVFGGGEAGIVWEGVTVNMLGGTVAKDLYGGGALADTQLANNNEGNTPSTYVTTVNLKGGTINHNAYGGGLGTSDTMDDTGTITPDGVQAMVYGDVILNLNEGVANTSKGCIVKGSIFGCNNLNGTPKGNVTVHIHKTQNAAAETIANPVEGEKTAKVMGRYDVTAVYGGGNLSAYEPKSDDATARTASVIIDGCGLTSICQVYGGGNAASTPATNVTVNGTYEINELFGGGNGQDDIIINSVTLPNPGANVGYKNYSEFYKDGGVWKVRDKEDADTKEKRTGSSYVYGSGAASVDIHGGTIHRVFGGSNTKGNVRQTAVTMLEDASGCPFKVDEAYGGGKSASMDAEAKLLMACIPGLNAVYGGAEDADIHGDVSLTITNGTFDRVFGGNNKSGQINGSITVNIEEVGCRPIIIGELYGGGNLAPYSIYGYNTDGTPKESGANPSDDPEVNVKSFTSIGTVYGGGYGEQAVMVGSPTVNINEVADPESEAQNKSYIEDAQTKYYSNFAGDIITIDGHEVIRPSHMKGKMGAINSVFGGGNAAPVKGNTTVNVGTAVGDDIYLKVPVTEGTDLTGKGYYTKSGNNYEIATGEAEADTDYYKKYEVLGVDIRDNIYGGGNNAEVTGSTNVNIGKKKL